MLTLTKCQLTTTKSLLTVNICNAYNYYGFLNAKNGIIGLKNKKIQEIYGDIPHIS
jgi:hypothetical protein